MPLLNFCAPFLFYVVDFELQDYGHCVIVYILINQMIGSILPFYIGLHVKKRIHSMSGSSSSNKRGFLANGVGTACGYHCYVNQVHGKGKGNKR